MTEPTGKKWCVNSGVLYVETPGDVYIPNADEVFSAVFEDQYSQIVQASDVKHLKESLNFSQYPAELKIVVDTDPTGGIILQGHAVFSEAEAIVLPAQINSDHVVIGKTWYPFMPGAVEEVQSVLKLSKISEFGKISLRQYLSLLKESGNFIVNKVLPENIILPTKPEDEKTPKVSATLYPYQVKGWQWMQFLSNEKIGGILADEMGLGKTLQVITLITSLSERASNSSLIIAPSTLLENWRREFQKFSPAINTIIHQGYQRTGFPAELRKYNVVITSYDTVVRDSSLFNQIEWNIVICDEAQAIKNPSTKRAIFVKQVPRMSGFAVSGTPIENRLTDLWSLMDFAVPGYLGDLQQFETVYENSQDGPTKLESIISPLILRRTVAEVARDLPAKIVIPQILELTDEEIQQYEVIRSETMREFNTNASLVVLTRLRMFCTHPFLSFDYTNTDPASCSNKYARLVEIVDEIILNAAKVLIFTSYNKMNDILVSDLRKRFSVYCGSIDGRTPVAERQKVVDDFSKINGAGILILNPAAAGTGLNITAANHVIHYNLEWNPAKEDQASARAYRRGQDRPVTIHRLIYANTVEEIIDDRLQRKRELAGAAIVGVQGNEEDYNDIFNAINKSPK